MSPRSAEFFDAARQRLRTAATVADDDPSSALSAAHYAMLYDYDAWLVPAEEAQRVIELARTFLAAVDDLLAD